LANELQDLYQSIALAERRLFSSPPADVLADTLDRNALTGIELIGPPRRVNSSSGLKIGSHAASAYFSSTGNFSIVS
jgi:hypothetical protein